MQRFKVNGAEFLDIFCSRGVHTPPSWRPSAPVGNWTWVWLSALSVRQLRELGERAGRDVRRKTKKDLIRMLLTISQRRCGLDPAGTPSTEADSIEAMYEFDEWAVANCAAIHVQSPLTEPWCSDLEIPSYFSGQAIGSLQNSPWPEDFHMELFSGSSHAVAFGTFSDDVGPSLAVTTVLLVAIRSIHFYQKDSDHVPGLDRLIPLLLDAVAKWIDKTTFQIYFDTVAIVAPEVLPTSRGHIREYHFFLETKRRQGISADDARGEWNVGMPQAEESSKHESAKGSPAPSSSKRRFTQGLFPSSPAGPSPCKRLYISEDIQEEIPKL